MSLRSLFHILKGAKNLYLFRSLAFQSKHKTRLKLIQSNSRTYSILPLQTEHFNHDNRTGTENFTYQPLLLAIVLFFTSNNSDFLKDQNALFTAILNRNTAAVKSLLSQGADVNTRHKYGWTPLHAAVATGSVELVRLLLKSGADINAQDEFSSVQRLAKKTGLSARQVWEQRDSQFSDKLDHSSDFNGFTALHYSVLLGDNKMTDLLITKGINATLEAHAGYTAKQLTNDPQLKKLLDRAEEKSREKENEREREEKLKFPLELRFKEVIIGQDGPILSVSAAIRRRENGWGDDEHPLVFLFIGSSGIGKTELAKQLAKYIHGKNPKGFIRLDMSEFQQKHEVAKFIGAPPGYIGFDSGGQVTDKLRECPNAVVLFDEVEKAHPDVLTIMLQLFDEGRLTDGLGKTVECKDAIFVMTSNLASNEIANHAVKLRQDVQLAKQERRERDISKIEDQIVISRDFKRKVVEPILKRTFLRDEFLGRINEILYFLPFTRSELNQLVLKEMEFWKSKAYERHKISLTWERGVVDLLADAYNIKYGARSIKYEVERSVVSQLAMAHERRLIQVGDEVNVRVVEIKGGSVIQLQRLEGNRYTDIELTPVVM
ncbi:Caseinolytic peptidase B protein-like [Oopsacas minuta]|uniref:Caseinolytic peptidase B protein-like n=1 Tax=Oopsacas minuta TaxID=111878 RepID=A0AAV7K7G0_9METZ|nr:Caseinolytic peptidase B protein-like [Oopsacas minuta]